MARARPWVGARCVLAALGQHKDPFDDDAAHFEAQLVGARLIADGMRSVSLMCDAFSAKK